MDDNSAHDRYIACAVRREDDVPVYFRRIMFANESFHEVVKSFVEGVISREVSRDLLVNQLDERENAIKLMSFFACCENPAGRFHPESGPLVVTLRFPSFELYFECSNPHKR